MRVSIAVNGASHSVAAIKGPGYLHVHLNMSDRPKEDGTARSVRIVGTETHETETVRFEWPSHDLKISDKVEIHILDDGSGDTPSAVRRSSEAPQNLFSNVGLARELLQAVSDFESRLLELLNKSEESEPQNEHNKIVTSVTQVTVEIGDRLLYPVYRNHPELVPEELKGELL